jgi:hypothetical protein
MKFALVGISLLALAGGGRAQTAQIVYGPAPGQCGLQCNIDCFSNAFGGGPVNVGDFSYTKFSQSSSQQSWVEVSMAGSLSATRIQQATVVTAAGDARGSASLSLPTPFQVTRKSIFEMKTANPPEIGVSRIWLVAQGGNPFSSVSPAAAQRCCWGPGQWGVIIGSSEDVPPGARVGVARGVIEAGGYALGADSLISSGCGGPPTNSGGSTSSFELIGTCAWAIEHPVSRTVCPGGTAQFTFSVGGTAVYRWRRDGVPLTNSPGHVVGADEATLTVIGVQPGDIGAYDCVVADGLGHLCPQVQSAEAALSFPTADFNGDGDLGTDADIEAFFACLAGSCCPGCGSADFNGDGDLGTDGDIEAFYRVLGGGSC